MRAAPSALSRPLGVFDFYRHFPWFLPVHRYDTPAQLLAELGNRVIEPSEAKALEFRSTPRGNGQ